MAIAGIGRLTGSVVRARYGGVEIRDTVNVAALAGPAAGMTVGPASGVPELRIFGDYQCPACAALERMAGDTLRALARRGHIRFVYHHAPLRAHSRGAAAAAAVHCAARFGSPWAAHTALYESTGSWGLHPAPSDAVVRVLARTQPDTAAMRECIAAGSTQGRIEADRFLAETIGITEVPTVFWDDQRLHIRSWPALVRFITARTAAS